ncbi:ATP-dependent DNA helicase [Kytococcus sp. Marseille-QA3725]
MPSPSAPPASGPDAVAELLTDAVAAVGGSPREGQERMARAVAETVERTEHLLVQAGTGTGKSLAYLVPAVAHAVATGKPVVVATATLALQAQIVDRDLPRVAEALRSAMGRPITYALVKGRNNYLCQHKLLGGFPDDDEGALVSMGQVDSERSALGEEVVRLREWAEVTESGDRDELVPGVSNKAWRQVSVSARECFGASRCPVASECFVEQSRSAAADVDVIVTNHAFLAIDAIEGRAMLPEHDLLVIDEAHELVDRVTGVATDELTPGAVAVAARRAGKYAGVDRLEEAEEALAQAMAPLPEGTLRGAPDALADALVVLRDAARGVSTDLKPEKGEKADGPQQTARAAVDEVGDVAQRLLEERELDVVWVAPDRRRDEQGKVLRVAPLSVAMLLREKVFSERTVVMTSATLELGGSFDAVAGTLGLIGAEAPAWTGLDVGSPFDYPRQAMAYVASHLPAPGRDGAAPEQLDEMEALIRAAGGRTLGLFSSMRAARVATDEMRKRLGDDIEVLCQGEDQLPTLVRRFAGDASTCLFGTLSLWQGVDVPGSACQLVLIDRLPFPRPDDPLSSARSQAVARNGGNGFMAVSATHAALRLAQGSGRLVRRADDRGVVAFLDPRIMTARYAGFLQRSLPPFWPTQDRALVLGALERLDATAPEPLPVTEVRARTLVGGGRAGAPPVSRSARTAVTGGEAWTDADDEALREALADARDEGGVARIEQVAQGVGRPPDVVAARLEQLDLSLEANDG